MSRLRSGRRFQTYPMGTPKDNPEEASEEELGVAVQLGDTLGDTIVQRMGNTIRHRRQAATERHVKV